MCREDPLALGNEHHPDALQSAARHADPPCIVLWFYIVPILQAGWSPRSAQLESIIAVTECRTERDPVWDKLAAVYILLGNKIEPKQLWSSSSSPAAVGIDIDQGAGETSWPRRYGSTLPTNFTTGDDPAMAEQALLRRPLKSLETRRPCRRGGSCTRREEFEPLFPSQ